MALWVLAKQMGRIQDRWPRRRHSRRRPATTAPGKRKWTGFTWMPTPPPSASWSSRASSRWSSPWPTRFA